MEKSRANSGLIDKTRRSRGSARDPSSFQISILEGFPIIKAEWFAKQGRNWDCEIKNFL